MKLRHLGAAFFFMFEQKLNMKTENILFLDVETVPQVYRFRDLSQRQQLLFNDKTRYGAERTEQVEDRYDKAGILAEFGKVVCISYGYIKKSRNKKDIIIRSCYGHQEKKILQEFCKVLQHQFDTADHFLCAHNGKGFDFPYLCRRMIVQEIPLPFLLQLQNKRPWEVRHLDTMEMWKFGDYKHYTSLDLLAEVLGVPSPKTEMNGSEVAKTYWEEKNLKKIVKYCEQDVTTLMEVFLRFQGLKSPERKK